MEVCFIGTSMTHGFVGNECCIGALVLFEQSLKVEIKVNDAINYCFGKACFLYPYI
jgi:hypothetical protein